MADFVEYKNNKGETTIVLDAENSSVSVLSHNNGDRYFEMDGRNGSMRGIGLFELTNPSDGSEVLFDTGALRVKAQQHGTISIASVDYGTSVSLMTSRGIVVRNKNQQDVVDISADGVVKLLDNSGTVRFEFFDGDLRLRNSAGDVTFSVDGETGDVRYKGTLSQF
jgi:DNA/RNA endonuclease YhcR with UshA esterase domain